MDNQTSVSSNEEAKVESAFSTLASNAHSSTATNDAISVLAEWSRQNTDVRQRLSLSKNLESLVAVINHNISGPGVDSAIRCICNACADNDPGRENISGIGWDWAIRCLDSNDVDEYIKMITSQALFNICLDYEPAQQACYRAKIHHRLLRFCHSDYVKASQQSGLIIDLIFQICAHKQSIDNSLQEDLPHDVLVSLVELPKIYSEDPDTDTYALLVESTLVFLRDPTVQKQIIHDRVLHDCWALLQLLEDRVSRTDDDEDLKILTPLSTSVNWCLSDVAALPEFTTAYPLESTLVERLVKLIKTADGRETSDDGHELSQMLLTAACQVVGNLLWALPPETYEHLVVRDELHRSCLRCITKSSSDTESSESFHALTGLLIHLTRPSTAARELIGADENCQPALQRLSQHVYPSIKQDVIKLIKALGKDCPVNQERFGELAVSTLASLNDDGEKLGQSEQAV